jgi:hypothetical protein
MPREIIGINFGFLGLPAAADYFDMRHCFKNMILVQRYQERAATSVTSVPTAGTLSLTNVKAEQADQDPFFMSQTKTITETRSEHQDTDTVAGSSTIFPR